MTTFRDDREPSSAGRRAMSNGMCIALIIAGAILRFALTARSPHGLNVHVVGDILILAGVLGLILPFLTRLQRHRQIRPPVAKSPADLHPDPRRPEPDWQRRPHGTGQGQPPPRAPDTARRALRRRELIAAPDRSPDPRSPRPAPDDRFRARPPGSATPRRVGLHLQLLVGPGLDHAHLRNLRTLRLLSARAPDA